MSTAEDLLLLATEPRSGKCLLSSMIVDVTLGGAILVDLVNTGRVELRGTKSKARVVLTDKTPVGDPVLDKAIFTLQTKGPMRAQSAVKLLGKKAKQPLYEALRARGDVRSEESRTWGLFTMTRWPVVDTVRRDNLVRLIQASLMHDQPADEVTGPLIGLLAAADKLRIVVEKPEVKTAKARAKVVAEGDWASAEVRKAIQAANSAMMIAVIAATSAGAAGS